MKGMNNLKGGVKINTFDLPSNDPAGGIHLTLDTSVTNVSYLSRSFPLIVLTTVSRSRRKSVSSCRRSRYRTSSRTSTSVLLPPRRPSISPRSRPPVCRSPAVWFLRAPRAAWTLSPRCSTPSYAARTATSWCRGKALVLLTCVTLATSSRGYKILTMDIGLLAQRRYQVAQSGDRPPESRRPRDHQVHPAERA